MSRNDIKRLITLKTCLQRHHELHTLWGARQHQLQPNVNYTGRHVREGDPEKLCIPAGAVSGSRVGSSQSVLHAVGHLGEVSVTDCIHDQTLDLDVWKWRSTKIYFVLFFTSLSNVYCWVRFMILNLNFDSVLEHSLYIFPDVYIKIYKVFIL